MVGYNTVENPKVTKERKRIFKKIRRAAYNGKGAVFVDNICPENMDYLRRVGYSIAFFPKYSFFSRDLYRIGWKWE